VGCPLFSPFPEIFAVRVFGADGITYPSLVARGILRAAAEQCAFVNLSLSVAPGPGNDVLTAACANVLEAGCILVASARPDRTGWLPASLPGVYAVTADDTLEFGDVRIDGPLARGARQAAGPGLRFARGEPVGAVVRVRTGARIPGAGESGSAVRNAAEKCSGAFSVAAVEESLE